jgi:hypothetical protein
MPDNPRSRSNQRGNLRKAVLWSGTLATAKGSVDCRIINISTSGAKVRSSAELHNGEHVTLAIRNLGEFHSTVVWVREGHFGLHFVEQKEGGSTDEAIETAAAEATPPAQDPTADKERAAGSETPAAKAEPAPTPMPSRPRHPRLRRNRRLPVAGSRRRIFAKPFFPPASPRAIAPPSRSIRAFAARSRRSIPR